MKKFLGLIFAVLSAVSLYGLFVHNTSGLSDQAVSSVFSVLLNAISAVFFFSFDSVYKKDYLDGFITRDTQCLVGVILFAFYAIPSFVALATFGATVGSLGGEASGIFNTLFSAVIPYVIPMFIFAIMLDIYYLPYRLSKKLFLYSDSDIENYLSDDADYTSYSKNGHVLANKDALLLPRFFCVIPICKIKTVKASLPWLVSIKLHNGKKFTIYTKNGKYIQDAVTDNKKQTNKLNKKQ